MRAHVSLHGGGEAIALDMDVVELRFAPGNAWSDARWVFLGPAERMFAAAAVTSIGAEDAQFDVRVVDGEGCAHGPFRAEGVIAGHPHGALCFIFYQNRMAFWEGVTIALSYQRLAIMPCEFDPA